MSIAPLRPSSPTLSGHERLRGIELLHRLPDHILSDLVRQFAWRNYGRGQQIVARASRDRHVYFIVTGKVRVCLYSASGRGVAFRDVGAGKCFGEISAIDGLPRSADVEALEDCTVASIPPQLFWKLLENYPQVVANVVRLLSFTVRSLSDRLFELSTLGVQNRVHAEILRLAKEAGIQNNTAILDPAPKHTDIASRISANREQVTKEISAMRRLGLVVLQGRQALLVPDVRRLERIVNEASK
jgi:CRP-like cAMP-binding protein